MMLLPLGHLVFMGWKVMGQCIYLTVRPHGIVVGNSSDGRKEGMMDEFGV